MNVDKQQVAFLVAAAILSLVGCQSAGLSGVEETTAIETKDGAIIVDTFSATATVAAIDGIKRKVTLLGADGHKTTYKAGPEVVNFNQLQIGDKVNVVVTEEAAVFIGHGEPPSAGRVTAVALAPVGGEPGGIVVDTAQVTGRVTAVDAKNHKVTFALPDGTTKKVKVGKNVDLAYVVPGDNVTVQLSEGLAITVARQ